MSNVLPQETRSRIESLIKARLFVVASLIIMVSAIVALLAILPAYVSIYVPKLALEETSRELRAAEAQAGDDKETVAKTRALVAELAAVKAEPVIAPLIEAVLAEKPEGIAISNISYRPGSPGTLVLTGSSADRRDLEAYRERLAAMQRFDSISVPVAALVGALAGSFTITIAGTF